MCVCVCVCSGCWDAQVGASDVNRRRGEYYKQGMTCVRVLRKMQDPVSRNERRHSQSMGNEPGKTDRQRPEGLMSHTEFRVCPEGLVYLSSC